MNYNTYNNVRKPVNRNAVARIVIWSVVLVILVTVLVSALLLGDDWSVYGFSLGGYDYDDTNYQTGSGVTKENVNRLSVDWPAGEVIVMPSDTDEVVITEEFDGEDALRVRWCIENGELKIKYRSPVGFGKLTAPSKKLTVAIPGAMLDSMKKVDIELVSANLTVTGMSADEVDATVVSGTVNMTCRFVDLVDLETVSGNVKFAGNVKKADFEGVSARIELLLGDNAATVNVETVSGDVFVLLPETVSGFEAVVDAVSGSLRVDGFDGLTPKKDSCRFGDGKVKITADAVSGSLKIGKTAAQ